MLHFLLLGTDSNEDIGGNMAVFGDIQFLQRLDVRIAFQTRHEENISKQ
jgi:hypothetical protein